jgi:RNA polymerase sigma-70 factor, ECF subfamily
VTGGQALQEAAPEITEDDHAAERELAGYVAPFVAMLPSPYREALMLTELEGLTQKQAADMIGISLSGMKSRVQRGRQQLRKALEDCCHIALDARGRVVSYEPRPDGRLPSGCCTQPPIIDEGPPTLIDTESRRNTGGVSARGSSRYSPESDSK